MPTELTDRCWLIELRGVNAYLVEDLPAEVVEEADVEAPSDAPEVVDDDEYVLTLVDAGTPLDAERLAAEIEATGHDVSEIERVLLTHYDIDHAGGLTKLGLRDATVYVGRDDADLLAGRARPDARTPKGLLHRLTGPFTDAPDLAVEAVGDGDRVGTFQVYETPGHTPGHVAYASEALSIAFVGDLVIERDGELRPSPWYLSYDTEDVRESIHDFADREPAVEVLAMGHGVPFLRGGSVRLAELGQRIE
jgi:glyoxylase-like metal-dependent hydrolase (beta-lactamase superfamily II)